MRYQVPQFVDIEDKILGPFTLRQFLIYLVAVLCLIPVFLASDISLFLTIAVPVLGLAAMFAHFKLNGKNLFAVLGNATQFASRGQLFLWQRTVNNKPLKVTGVVATQSEAQFGGLSDRARKLETQGNVVNKDEQDPFDVNSPNPKLPNTQTKP